MRPRILGTPLLVGTRRDHRGEPLPGGLYRDHIADAEAWCVFILERALDHIDMHVTAEEKEDLIGDVLELLLKLERDFKPERNPSFAGYASWVVPRRIIDLAPRALLGRNGGRIAQRSHEELDESAPGRSRHLETLTTEPGDTHPDQRPGAGRLERDRARLETWADTELGLRAA